MISAATFRIGWLGRLLLAGLLAGVCGVACAAGYERIEVPARGAEPAIQAMVWSPCAIPAGAVKLGAYVVRAQRDCRVSGQSLPLIVISHGQGGSFLGHHDTAEALVDAGFVVVTFNHPGDAYGDDASTDRLSIFESRPRDVSRVISFMLEDWASRRHLDGASIGVFGFSRGGYTALALAGAVPSLPASADRFCAHWWSFITSLCRQMSSRNSRLNPAVDRRVRAIAAADPLNLFDAAGLRPVRVPVQLWASEQGGEGVALAHVEAIRSALPQVPEYHLARGAGHFAYLAPCPPAIRESARHLCEDPDGFDRTAWHGTMNAAVVSFFRRHLQQGTRP